MIPRRHARLTRRPVTAAACIAINLGLGCTVLFAAGLPRAGQERWHSLGPGGGTVQALLLDPSARGVLYAATDVGVFRSTDGGDSWVGRGLGIGADTIRRFAGDPAHPGTIYALSFGSLYRTTNDGGLWVPLAHAADNYGGALTIVAGSLPVIVVGDGCDLVRSTDGGASWMKFFSFTGFGCGVQTIVPDPSHPGDFFVATAAGIFEVDDTGRATQHVDDMDFNALVIAPSDPQTLYAVNIDTGWRTRDGGHTWTQFSRAGELISGGYCLAVSPTAPATVYLCDAEGGVAVSYDAGDSWRKLARGYPNDSLALPEQTNAIAIDPSSGQIWAAVWEFGVLHSGDGGRSWSVLEQSGLTANAVGFVTPDSHQPDTLYARFAPRLEVQRSVDGGQDWSVLAGAPLASTIVLDPAEPGTLYAVDASGIFRSRDGDTWSALLGGPFADLAFPLPGVIVAGGCGIMRSVDGGSSWSETFACHRNHPLSVVSVQGFVADPTDPETLYAEVARGQSAGVFEIWRSGDAGATWERIELSSPTVAVDPTRHGTLWASLGPEVLMTTDGGSHWTVVGEIPEVEIARLIAGPTEPPVLYAGTESQGVFRSCNGGRTWHPLGKGLAGHSTIVGLTLSPDDPHRLFATPQEGGLFEIQDSEPCG